MATFHYLAIDVQGKSQKGVIEAATAKQARQSLRDKNLIPTEIQDFKHKKWFLNFKVFPILSLSHFSLKTALLSRASLSNKELTLITKQLATLFAAGLPISEVLTAVSEQSSSPQATRMLGSIRTKVVEGHSLASALREYPQAFSPLFCGLVAAGEKSGKLVPILQRLANYTEQQYKLKQKVKQALIYPSVLVFVSLSIILFLLEYVVPKMVSVYGQMNQSLPLLTRILISLSAGIKSWGSYLLLLLSAALWGFRYTLTQKPGLREQIHRFLLRLPLLGTSIKSINTARYARTLALLSSSGIPILEGMNTSAELLDNLPIRKSVEEAAKQVREGAAIHLALKRTSYFSALSIHLIASGEASGQLEQVLEHSALQQEEEISRLLDTLLTLFEPFLILLMGSLVLFIVLAVLLPIFELNQLTI